MFVAVTVGSEIVGIVIIGLLLAVAVVGVGVCALKGKWIFAFVGLFCGVFWLIGALRLGKPDSWWAKRRYGDAEMAEANRRFSRKVVPRLGDSSFREGVSDGRPDPRDADLGRMG